MSDDRHIKRQLGIDRKVEDKHDYRKDTAFDGARLVRLPDRTLVRADEYARCLAEYERTQAAAAGPLMYVHRMDAFLNRWFAGYDEARASLEADGGFLFPYRDQFFVTEKTAVRELGLDPDDPDWASIGHDWVRPADEQAWKRLRLKREIASD